MMIQETSSSKMAGISGANSNEERNYKDFTRIQHIALDILKDIVDVCDRNGIDYILYYGSLLGAVRHKGIIPWDNDIDIAMTRDNYEQFLKVAPQQLSSKNRINIMGSKWMSELKIGRKGTKYCLNFAQDLDIMNQVAVDIFRIDYIRPYVLNWLPVLDPFKNLLRHAKLSWDEKRLLFRCIDRSTHRFKWVYKFALASLHILRLVFTESGLDWAIHKLFVDTSYTSPHLGIIQNPLKHRPWPASFKYITMPFNDMIVKAPDCYDLLLRGHYGDYMKLPPEDKRYPSHLEDWILEVEE